jgi:hypothetical protein
MDAISLHDTLRDAIESALMQEAIEDDQVILAQRALLETRSAVEQAVGDYIGFLSAMRHVDALEPSALVDLVWHTHQQMTDRYHKDCVRIAGRLLDHDDTPERTCISVGG